MFPSSPWEISSAPSTSLAKPFGLANHLPTFGVVVPLPSGTLILGVDALGEHESVVIQPLYEYRPPGISGVALLSNGEIAAVVNLQELLTQRDGCLHVQEIAAWLTPQSIEV